MGLRDARPIDDRDGKRQVFSLTQSKRNKSSFLSTKRRVLRSTCHLRLRRSRLRKNLLPVPFDFTEGDDKRRASLFEKSETISKVHIFIEDKRKGK